jgi:PadR family transcriptional regulator PadR
MNEYKLGEFEEIVLLTVGLLCGKAYGVAIKDENPNRREKLA